MPDVRLVAGLASDWGEGARPHAMPERILGCGRLVQLDWEDAEWFDQRTWRAWRERPERAYIVVCDEYRAKRSFRLRLLREIAVRMRPELVGVSGRVRVMPLNGDAFDARRANLNVVVGVGKASRPKTKPKGGLRGATRGRRKTRFVARKDRDLSPLWNHGS